MNPVADYVTTHHERLGLERLGVPRRPECVLLTPRFRRSRHVIVLVLAADRRDPVLVGKLPRLAGDGAALAAEAHGLRSVATALPGQDAGTAPALIAHRAHGGYPLLLERALAGAPLAPRIVRRERRAAVAAVAGWLERLAAASASPAEAGWYERLVEPRLAAGGWPAEARTRDLAERLRGAELPLVFEHGDLRHPNLLRQPDGRLGVLDWERADPAGLPGADLFAFIAYAATAGAGPRRRPRALRAAFARGHGWAWPVLERYARRLGIDPDLLPSLRAVSEARE